MPITILSLPATMQRTWNVVVSILMVVLLIMGNTSTSVLCQTVCRQAQTCQECYSIPMGCAWCSSPSILDGNRCFDDDDNSCPAKYTEDRQSSIDIDQLELTSDNQISIRKATVKLRTGDSQSFQVKVRPAENFPLDLYMIVDLSYSLLDDLVTIKSISSDIADAIRNISTRFQIGFGTYVDKLTPPYTSLFAMKTPFMVQVSADEIRRSACGDDLCMAPISYVHNVNLTNISSSFISGFDDLEISTNADSPEGTLDAMAQAILCTDVVGWRENARKIMVVVTDSTVHVAGDGIHAGILEQAPNDCKTRYEPERGIFTYVDNAKYDYPSIEQIRSLSKANLVSPVFAVLEEVAPFYRSLAGVLSGISAQVVTIQDGSKDIILALETAYKNIVSNVHLTYIVSEDAGFIITTTVSCPDGTVTNSDGMSCSNVTTNDTVIFTVNVTLLNCTEELADSSRIVNVIIPGYGRFEIEVGGICKCDCQETGFEVSSPMCSGNGTYACGVCECDPGWIGSVCNCRTDDIDSLNCPTDINGAECSSRGDCLCGECVCRIQDQYSTERTATGTTLYNISSSLFTGVAILLDAKPYVYGDSCECDNYRCPRNSTGFVCSGDHGNCTCKGDCECTTVEYGGFPYTGNDCSCNQAFCYNQSQPYTTDTEVCNGNGVCDPCNPREPCNCFAGYVRPYCTSSAQALTRCFGSGSFGRSCVKCIADNDNYEDSCPECFSSSLTSTYSRVGNQTDDLPGSIMDTTRKCSFITTDPICNYVYYMALGAESTSNDQRQIIHVEPSDCFPLLWWHIMLIILMILLMLGIVVISLIKIAFLILDYKEVQNFNKSVAETDLTKNVNPLYMSPEIKYDNIAFGREF